MKKLFVLLAFGFVLSSNAHAQNLKLAYINSLELLSSMPEKIKADTEVNKYTRSFQDELESMSKEYQTKIQQYQAGEKTMSDPIKEVKQKEIQDLQSRIESLQQSANDKVQQKRQALYQPILDKADKAIKEVAKEGNYDYIFDSSGGGLLYAKDEDNILGKVKAKLGIK